MMEWDYQYPISNIGYDNELQTHKKLVFIIKGPLLILYTIYDIHTMYSV
jgi:hypothetical protein